MSTLEYPPCRCGNQPTTDRTRIAQPWNDRLAFAHGTICGCGARSHHPPFALKRGDRIFVRVSNDMPNTAISRLDAIRLIPRPWQYRAAGYTFLDEQRYGAYRWWEFQIVYRTVE